MSVVGFVLAFLKQISKVFPAVIYLNFPFDKHVEYEDECDDTANLYREVPGPQAPPLSVSEI